MKVLSLFLAIFLFSPPLKAETYVNQGTGVLNHFLVTITGPPVKVLNANPSRAYLLIENVAVANGPEATIKFGASTISSAVQAEGIHLGASAIFQPTFVPQDAVWIRSSGGSLPIVIYEGVH